MFYSATIVYCGRLDQRRARGKKAPPIAANDLQYPNDSSRIVDIGCTRPGVDYTISRRLQGGKELDNLRLRRYWELHKQDGCPVQYTVLYSETDLQRFDKRCRAEHDKGAKKLNHEVGGGLYRLDGYRSRTRTVNDLESAALGVFAIVFGALPATNDHAGRRKKSAPRDAPTTEDLYSEPPDMYIPIYDLKAFCAEGLIYRIVGVKGTSSYEAAQQICNWADGISTDACLYLVTGKKCKSQLASVVLRLMMTRSTSGDLYECRGVDETQIYHLYSQDENGLNKSQPTKCDKSYREIWLDQLEAFSVALHTAIGRRNISNPRP